jgi:energy-coupling factor transport system substrate-specific component
MRSSSSLLILMSSLIGLSAFTWPLFVSAENDQAARWLFLAIMPIVALIVIAELTMGQLNVKALAFLGVLSATGAALRAIGAGAVGLEPIWFLIIIGARAMGKRFGFVLGMTTMLASALLTGGVGPWLAFQMMCAAWIGWGAGALPSLSSLSRKRSTRSIEIFLLATYAAVSAFLFGLLMDLQLWPWIASPATTIAYLPGDAVLENLQRFMVFHLATAMAWDIPRAIFNIILILLLGRPILNSLRRAMRRGNFEIIREPAMARTAALPQ